MVTEQELALRPSTPVKALRFCRPAGMHRRPPARPRPRTAPPAPPQPARLCGCRTRPRPAQPAGAGRAAAAPAPVHTDAGVSAASLAGRRRDRSGACLPSRQAGHHVTQVHLGRLALNALQRALQEPVHQGVSGCSYACCPGRPSQGTCGPCPPYLLCHTVLLCPEPAAWHSGPARERHLGAA